MAATALWITLRELAKVLGKSISQVQRYEIEENPITVDDLAKIARHLQVPLTDFIDDTSETTESSTEEAHTHA